MALEKLTRCGSKSNSSNIEKGIFAYFMEGLALEFYDKNDRSIKSLIELGAKGYFPLFDSSWLSEFYSLPDKKLTGNEKAQAKKLLKRVSKHRSLERKKTVIFSMQEDDRNLVLKAFFKMVENKILDTKPQIQ